MDAKDYTKDKGDPRVPVQIYVRNAAGDLVPADSASGGLPVASPSGLIVTGTKAFGSTTYGAGLVVGGLLAIPTGLSAGRIITPLRLHIMVPLSNLNTGQNLIGHVFEGNPTGSTVTDHTALSVAAADFPKISNTFDSGNTNVAGGASMWSVSISNRMAVDADGNIFAAVCSKAASLVFNGAGSFYWRLEATL